VLSELFYQSRFIKISKDFGASAELRLDFGKTFSSINLQKMNTIKKEQLKTSKIPFSIITQTLDLMVDYPPITLQDNKEVIHEWIKQRRKEGINITLADIPERHLMCIRAGRGNLPLKPNQSLKKLFM